MNIYAKIKLFILRVIFITLLCVVKLSTVRNLVLLNKVRQGRNLIKKIAYLSLLIFKPISMIFGSVLNLFSIIEWRLSKYKKHGSCQYLIFEKL